jgi:hypothetical protein
LGLLTMLLRETGGMGSFSISLIEQGKSDFSRSKPPRQRLKYEVQFNVG